MKTNEVIDLMQAFLNGAIMGLLSRDGRDYMKIVEFDNIKANSFEILMASGLRLAVKVEVVEGGRECSGK